MAGLVCAGDLIAAGVECVVLEASDDVGGRVRTDKVDGFVLDRGFQILLTAYPQVRKRLNLDALNLGFFEPGARVRAGGRFHALSDPLRRPWQLPATLCSPVGTLTDKLRTAALVAGVVTLSAPKLLRRTETTTASRLRRARLSPAFVAQFWQPLFAGIQLDPGLDVSSRRFDIILKMLATGRTSLPAEGMGAVPHQIAGVLPPGTVRVATPVASVAPGSVVLNDGERLAPRAVVVATDGPSAKLLLPGRVADPGSRAAACCWFASPAAPVPGPWLLLDGEGTGPARNVVVVSEVQPAYAPAGSALVAAAVPGHEALRPGLTSRVREQLARWFATSNNDLQHMGTNVIAHGQPLQSPPFHPAQRVDLGEGLYGCGDHRDTASLQGAMFSGERTAQAVLRHLRRAS